MDEWSMRFVNSLCRLESLGPFRKKEKNANTNKKNRISHRSPTAPNFSAVPTE